MTKVECDADSKQEIESKENEKDEGDEEVGKDDDGGVDGER
jgi:hypothetical protein